MFLKHQEDCLPKMICCGNAQNKMPKLVVCDEPPHKPRDCMGPCTKPPKSKEPKIDCVQQQLMLQNCCLNEEIKKLQCELCNRDRSIAMLQTTICSLECEVNCLKNQNMILNQKMQEACLSRTKSTTSRKSRCSNKSSTGIECRLEEFTMNARLLEQQVDSMEKDVKMMKDTLGAIQAERAKAEKKIITVFAPGCPAKFPSCPPSRCR